MGSYCVDSYELDPGRTEGRNLLTVIGGGGGGSTGAADGTQQKRKSSQKLFHLLLIKIVMCLVNMLKQFFFCGRDALSV